MIETFSQPNATLTQSDIEELLRCALSYTSYLSVFSDRRLEIVSGLVQRGFLETRERTRATRPVAPTRLPRLKRGTKLFLTKQGEQAILDLTAEAFAKDVVWPSARDVKQAQERVRKSRSLAG